VSVNQSLFDTLLQHQHYLLATEAHVVAKTLAPLKAALREVQVKMAKAGFNPASFTGMRAIRLERQLTDLVQAATWAGGGRLQEELAKIIQAENQAQTGILKDALPAPVDALVSFERIPLPQLTAMIQTPLGGKTLNDRLVTMNAGAAEDVRRALSTAVLLGEGVDAAARRIREYVTGGTAYNATRIARTEIHRVANAVTRDVYDRHREVLGGLQFVATLDPRTCFDCSDLDGSIYYYESEPLVEDMPEIPVHPMCRCTTAPVTKSWSQLGFTKDDLKGFPGLRDMDGLAAKTPAYGDWFKRQPVAVQKQILGPARWMDWAAGKLSFRSMADAAAGRVKPLAPSKLAMLRGLGAGAAPLKPVATAKTVIATQAEIRRMVRDAVLSAGVPRKDYATYLRAARAGQRRELSSLIRALGTPGKSAEALTRLHQDAQRLLQEALRIAPRATKQAWEKGFLRAMPPGSRAGGNTWSDVKDGLKVLNDWATMSRFGSGALAQYLREGDSATALAIFTGARTRAYTYRSGPTTTVGASGLLAAMGATADTVTVHLPTARVAALGSWGAITDEGTISVDALRTMQSLYHELGHAAEYASPELAVAAKAFLAERTAGEAERWLGAGYDADERGREDKFWHAYTGKTYSDGSTEVVSMAVEQLPALMSAAGNPGSTLSEMQRDALNWLAYDVEHFQFLLRMAAGAF
jgi:SPP1 gp7 family putative phage head morphogenesis protein